MSEVARERPERLAELLRAHRRRAMLSQEELAELAQVSVRTIRDLERCRVARPRARSVRLLADALELEAEQREEFWSAAGAGLAEVPGATRSVMQAHSQCLPRQLPPDVSHFTGRDSELEQLNELLTAKGGQPGTMLIAAVCGMAGVGKTALAVHWAHLVEDQFVDGVLFANLRGYDPTGEPMTAGEVLDGFLRALCVPPEAIPPTLEQRAALFRTRLAGRRMLIVLDNATSTDHVRELLPGTPGCVAVVTSRSNLSGLAATNGARRVLVEALSDAESLALLRRVSDAARVEAEPDAAAALTRWCAGLPLALRLAAERVNARPHHSLVDLANELTSGVQRLDLLAGDDDSAALRAVFSWSYRSLSPDVARAFRLIGLHPGPTFSLEAVAALAGVADPRARRLVEVLTSVHLLQEIGRYRYRFHDLLRVYAVDRAHADEPRANRDAALDRLFDWYAHTADNAAQRLMPQRPRAVLSAPQPGIRPLPLASVDAALAWCAVERVNLVFATRRAVETGRNAVAWRLPCALWSYMAICKQWDDWLSTHQLGLTAARQCADRYGEALVLASLGGAYAELRRFDEAFATLESAIVVSDSIDEPSIEGFALNLMAVGHLLLGQLDSGLQKSQRALDLFGRVGNPSGQAWALGLLAAGHRRLGDHDRALRCARQSLALFRRNNGQFGMSFTLQVLAQVYRDLGQFGEAADYAQQAFATSRQTGHRVGEALALYTLGEVQFHTDQIDRAQRSWREALAIFEEIGAPQAAEVRARLR